MKIFIIMCLISYLMLSLANKTFNIKIEEIILILIVSTICTILYKLANSVKDEKNKHY